MQRLLMFIVQLNVTVSPVPGLPEGLTYNCSFSGSGAGFPLVVPAIELEAGTQYQCNITGRISDLSSIAHGMSEHTQRLIKCSISLYHAVTDFSFISVELGMPFATSSNALTIYNCSAAIRYDVVYVYTVSRPLLCVFCHSCLHCLGTEGACGWCVYGGVCSGRPDPCPVPEAGVLNSYLTVHNIRSSYRFCTFLKL